MRNRRQARLHCDDERLCRRGVIDPVSFLIIDDNGYE